MTRLRQPGDSEYDVLGVSPGASEEEINRAFHRLIDEGGYKIGVPLNRQWLRAHQIKAAHATLSDSKKRRAYDESLSGAAGPAPWAMAASDPATDELVLSEKQPDAPEPLENPPALDAVPSEPEAIVLAGAGPEAEPEPDSVLAPEPDAPGPLENPPVPDAVPSEPEAPVLAGAGPEPEPDSVHGPDPDTPAALENPPVPDAVPSEPEAIVLTGAGPEPEPEPEPDSVPGPEPGAVAGWVGEQPPAPDLFAALSDDEQAAVPPLDDTKRASLRNWGMAAAAASILGLVLVSAWPGWNGQSPTGEETPGVTAEGWQASGAGPGLVGSPGRAPGNLDRAVAPGLEGQDETGDDSPAASDALGRPVEAQRTSDEVAPQGVDELAPREMADAQSPQAAAPSGTAPNMPEASSVPTEAVEARAVGPNASSTAGAPAATARSGSSVRSPAQWVGGGPTDTDNRRGRYQGTVAVQVNVDPDGRVSGCAPVRGSGNAGLDALTCRLVQERARFNPALDAQGRPVPSQAYTTFVWGRKPRN